MKINRREVKNANLYYWGMLLSTVMILIPGVGVVIGFGYVVFLAISTTSNKNFLGSHAWQALFVFAPIFILTLNNG